MLPQARDLASGSFVPSNPSMVGCRIRAGLPDLLPASSSGGGLFKRPVILWIRGAFICGEGSERAPRFHFRPIALADMRLQTKDYLSRSFEKIGTSSLFPDDKLR